MPTKCPECHAEQSDHALRRTTELVLLCKKCRKAFRKDLASGELDDSDEYCPNCDAHYVLAAKLPAPQGLVAVHGEADVRQDNSVVLDDRAKAKRHPTDLDAYADQLG